MAGWVPITSASQFFTVGESHPAVVVFVTAPWCFRCKQVAPKFAGFPQDFSAVHFGCIDLEGNEELGELLDIATLPTLLLLKGGQEVHRLAGVPQQRPGRALSLAIRHYLLGEAVSPGK